MDRFDIKTRMQYIGGSEVYKLFSSNVKDLQDLILSKTDYNYCAKKQQSFPEFYSKWGHQRELIILKRLEKQYSFIHHIYYNKENRGFCYNKELYPYMQATPDALTKDYLIECKTRCLYKTENKWKYSGIPFAYKIQTLYNMLQCHKKQGILCVEYYKKNSNNIIILDYEEYFFKKEDIAQFDFINKCKEFYEQYMGKR